MTLRYKHNDQPVALGERVFFLEQGVMYVRTGLLGTDKTDPARMTVTYQIREVYDDTAPIPTVTLTYEVPAP